MKFMKVSIGTKIKEGPWGGGNLFAINLKKYLELTKVFLNYIKIQDTGFMMIFY